MRPTSDRTSSSSNVRPLLSLLRLVVARASPSRDGISSSGPANSVASSAAVAGGTLGGAGGRCGRGGSDRHVPASRTRRSSRDRRQIGVQPHRLFGSEIRDVHHASARRAHRRAEAHFRPLDHEFGGIVRCGHHGRRRGRRGRMAIEAAEEFRQRRGDRALVDDRLGRTVAAASRARHRRGRAARLLVGCEVLRDHTDREARARRLHRLRGERRDDLAVGMDVAPAHGRRVRGRRGWRWCSRAASSTALRHVERFELRGDVVVLRIDLEQLVIPPARARPCLRSRARCHRAGAARSDSRDRARARSRTSNAPHPAARARRAPGPARCSR